MWNLRFVPVCALVHTDADRSSQQNWCFRGVNADRRGCEPTQQPVQTEVSTSGTCSWRCPESPEPSRSDQMVTKHQCDQLRAPDAGDAHAPTCVLRILWIHSFGLYSWKRILRIHLYCTYTCIAHTLKKLVSHAVSMEPAVSMRLLAPLQCHPPAVRPQQPLRTSAARISRPPLPSPAPPGPLRAALLSHHHDRAK